MGNFRWERYVDDGEGLKVQIVGSKKDKPKCRPYVRFEGANGEYLGSLSGRGVKSLRAQLRRAFGDE